MDQIIQLSLTLLEAIAPQLAGANANLIEKIIEGLVALVPLLITEYKSVIPFIQNVIVLLKSNNLVTTDQLATLTALETQIDASFETAAVSDLADDASGN